MNDSRWFQLLGKRQEQRSGYELTCICTNLRRYPGFDSLPPRTLFKFSQHLSIEELVPDVTLFKEGEERSYWFYILSGSLDSFISAPSPTNSSSFLSSSPTTSPPSNQETKIRVCRFGMGCSFGFSFGSGNNHSMTTSVSNGPSNCILMHVNKDTYNNIWTSTADANKLAFLCNIQQSDNCNQVQNTSYQSKLSPQNHDRTTGSTSLFILKDLKVRSMISKNQNFNWFNQEPSAKYLRIGWVLRTLILTRSPNVLKGSRSSRHNSMTLAGQQQQQQQSNTANNPIYMIGSELVDWLITVSSQTPVRVHSRSQAVAMLQVLYEDSVLLPFDYKKYILSDPDDIRGTLVDKGSFNDDPETFYRWYFDADGRVSSDFISDSTERIIASQEFTHCLEILIKSISECNLRSVFRKDPRERTSEDINLIFDEMMTIKALSDLNNAMKRELARVICYEYHSKQGEIVFNQGDPGFWWYLIYRGSVHVDIIGKGIVDTIHAGGDFGKLALVNHAPRAATIIVAEENTQFFKVHKDDFDRILFDVEANMIRLQEHGKNVLVLLKLNVNKNRAIQMSKISTSSGNANQQSGNNVSSTMLTAPSMSSIKSAQQSSNQEQSKFVVIQGTREKMIDYCLENKFDNNWNPNLFLSDDEQNNVEEENSTESNGKDGNDHGVTRSRSSSLFAAYLDLMSKDTYFQDLISTHIIYMSTATICNYLEQYYYIERQLSSQQQPVSSLSNQLAQVLNLANINGDHDGSDFNHCQTKMSFTSDDIDHIIKHKKRVIRFVYSWKLVIGFELFFTDNIIMDFLVKIHDQVIKDNAFYGPDCLTEEVNLTNGLISEKSFFDMATRFKGKKIKANLTGAIHVQDKQSDIDPPTNPDGNQLSDLMRRPSSATQSMSPSPATSPRRQLPRYPVGNQVTNVAHAPSLMVNDVSLQSPITSQYNQSGQLMNNKPRLLNNLQLNQPLLSDHKPSSAPGSPYRSDQTSCQSTRSASPSSPSQAAINVATSFVGLLTQGGARSKILSSNKSVVNQSHNNLPKNVPKINNANSNDIYNQRVNNSSQYHHESKYCNATPTAQYQQRPSSASSGYLSNYNENDGGSSSLVNHQHQNPVKSVASFSPTFLPSTFSSPCSSVSSSFLFNPTLHLSLTQRQSSASSSSQIHIEQGKQYYLDSINSSTKDGSMVTSKIFFPDPITDRDDVINRIYCADHTYTTLRCSVTKNASYIKKLAADKLGLNVVPETLIMAEVTSSGERNPFPDHEINIGTGISVNGRIFITINHHLDALTPLPEQDGPTIGTYSTLDDFTPHDLAHALTYHSWQLFINVHERELIYQAFGRDKFDKVTSNLDLLLRHFEEVRFWVTTELVFCNHLTKRVNLLRKFIKTAAICKEYQNVHTFFAIIIGLSDVAVSRLTQTWYKLPEKLRKTFSEYESLIDPTKNHRNYRMFMSDIKPPVIPFTPILLKDLSFAHQGNQTFVGDLINFEKMQMLAQAMRTFKFCRSKPLSLIESIVNSDMTTEASQTILSKKNGPKVEAYVKNLRAIDNQKLLITLSKRIERNHDAEK